MKYDEYGQVVSSSQDLCDLLYRDPSIDLSSFIVENYTKFNSSVNSLHYQTKMLKPYTPLNIPIEDFDQKNQANWYMPQRYKDIDISKWLLDQCTTQSELQRVGQELILYQDRNILPLLKYLKYLVDTLRTHKVVWGVGRGSSCASYVLYLIGVHRINSIKYELNIEEFLK